MIKLARAGWRGLMARISYSQKNILAKSLKMTIKFSKFISYFFHPINFPIIGTLLFFLFIPKFIFKPQEYTILIVIFIGTYISPLLLLVLCLSWINRVIQSLAKPYKLFLRILAKAVRVTNSEGVLELTVLSQQLAFALTCAGNCFAISCSMTSTSSWTLTNLCGEDLMHVVASGRSFALRITF